MKRDRTKARAKRSNIRPVSFAGVLKGDMTPSEAARVAGYADKPLTPSEHQPLNLAQLKMSEVLDSLGLTKREIIKNHLNPLLSHKDPNIRLKALDMILELGANYPTKESDRAERGGIDVLVIDIPRPRYDIEPKDVPQVPRPPKQREAPPGEAPKVAPNPTPVDFNRSRKPPVGETVTMSYTDWVNSRRKPMS